ncbi:hypothetical protein ACFL1G_11680 [Planctomycetota bacterium]
MMYAEASDGSTISDEIYNQKWGFTPLSGMPGPETWMSTLKRYYQDDDLLLCPRATITWGGNIESFGRKDRAWEIPPGAVEFAEGGMGSYGINDWIYNPPPDQTDGPWGFPIENIFRTINTRMADEIPLLTDCLHVGHVCEAWRGGYVGEPPYIEERPFTGDGTGYGRICMDRHGGDTINGLFLDGTVRTLGLKQLWTLRFAKDGGGETWDSCNQYTICAYGGRPNPSIWEDNAPWLVPAKDY